MVFSLLKRSLILGLLAFSAQYAYARPVIFTIDARSENGTQIGTAIGSQAQKQFPHIAKQYDSYLAFLFSPAQFKQLIPQVNLLKATVNPTYQAEVQAIATAWRLTALDNLGDGQLSVNEFWLLQLLPDLTAINKGSALAVTHSSDTHSTIAARNLDWKSTPDLRSLQTISIYQYEDQTLVNIGFAGLVSIINGFNDQGLFVSLMDASQQQVSTTLATQTASGFVLRTILKEHDKLSTAADALAHQFYPRSLQIVLADPENIAVLEQPLGEMGTLRKTDSVLINEMPWTSGTWLAAVNCFVLKTSPHNCQASDDYYRWGRFAQLLKAFDGQSLSVDDVIALMQDQANVNQAIFNEDTIQSLVFTPKDRALYLYSQSVLKTNEPHPVVEKYQLINSQSSPTEKLIDIIVLVLGVIVLAAAWIYIFQGDKKIKIPFLSK